jgi:hypothetical protein
MLRQRTLVLTQGAQFSCITCLSTLALHIHNTSCREFLATGFLQLDVLMCSKQYPVMISEYVVSGWRKADKDGENLTTSGRKFHKMAAVKMNDRLPVTVTTQRQY